MHILDIKAFIGANVHAPHSAVWMRVSVEGLATGQPWTVEQAVLEASMAGYIEGAASQQYGDSGEAVASVVTLGERIGGLALRLQRTAGAVVEFGEVRATAIEGDSVDVVFGCDDRDVGVLAGRCAVDLVSAAMAGAGADSRSGTDEVEQRQKAFRALLRRWAVDRQDQAVIAAARERGISWRFTWIDGLCITLGEGRGRRRTIYSATDLTSHAAVRLASNKFLTNRLLAQQGLPVARQARVRHPGEAAEAARRIGFPVVVKPEQGHRGKGVTVGLTTAAEVERAIEQAANPGRAALVESVIPGVDHRILVIGDRIVAAIKRLPASVEGDDVSSVDELVAAANRDPRRDPLTGTLYPIEIDAESERLLAKRGYDRSSVPRRGEIVPLRSAANWSQGGTTFDVTASIHPDNRAATLRAVKIIGLDVGGVDFLSPDIGRSYKEVGGGICEVQQQPSLLLHLSSENGKPPEVFGAFLDHLYPDGQSSRIPIVAVLEGEGSAASVELLARIIAAANRTVGRVTRAGVFRDGFTLGGPRATGPTGLRMIIDDPIMDAALIEALPSSVVDQGFGHDRCDILALMGRGEDAAGAGRWTAAAKTLLGITHDALVVDADDCACLALAVQAPSRRLWWVTLGDRAAEIDARKAQGAVVRIERVVRKPIIVIEDPSIGAQRIEIGAVEGGEPAALRARLFAVALAAAMGMPSGAIRSILDAEAARG